LVATGVRSTIGAICANGTANMSCSTREPLGRLQRVQYDERRAYGPGAHREGWDYEFPYLRAYFTNYGVPDENLRFISAERSLADLIPRFADQRPLAARSQAVAREEVISSVAAAGHAGAER
jgi:hypothetical protein